MKACVIIIKRPFSTLQLSNMFTEVGTSKLYVVFSGLPVVGKLICCPRKFDYQILVVCVAFNEKQ